MTHHRIRRARVIGLALMSGALLTGCASDPVTVAGPVLSDPPPGAVDALADAAQDDSDVAAWVIDLDRYYTDLDDMIGPVD